MFKAGILLDKRGTRHAVFEIDQPGYYRIDICQQDAQFHVEPHKVEFSLVRRRKSAVYGDRALHAELEDIKNSVNFAKLETSNESGWTDGKFTMKQLRGNPNEIYGEIIHANGRIESETYKYRERLLVLTIISYDQSMTANPINIGDYSEVELQSDINIDSTTYIPLSVLKMRYDLSHIDLMDYDVETNLDNARAYMAEVAKSETVVGIDFETSGLDFNLYSKEIVVGIIISDKDGRSRYFPFAHTKFPNLPLTFLDEILDYLKVIIDKHENLEGMEETEEYWDKFINTGLCAHNKKFEKKVFMKYGKDVRIAHDSMGLSVVVDPVMIKGAHSLKELEYARTGKKYLELNEIFTGEIKFQELDIDLTRAYACADGDNCRSVLFDQWAKLPGYSRKIYRLEADLSDLKAEQEYWGLRVDAKTFDEGKYTCNYVVDLLEKLIHTLARSDFKISSGDQLSDLLYNKLKCPIYVRTKTNKASTGAKAIKKLSNKKRKEPVKYITKDIVDDKGKLIIKADKLNEAEFPIVVLIEKYKEYVKLKTAFYNRIESSAIGKVINDKAQDYRFFFWINQNGASTGRQSSPAHQFPKKIKQAILSDSDDHILYDHDYSQIELRLIFSLAGETELIEMCKDPKNDIHRVIGSSISGLELWEISAAMRQRDKSRNFGVVYLISEFGLAVQKYGPGATKEQVKECKKSIEDFYHALKRTAKYVRDNRKKLERDGYMTTAFGRNKYFPKIFDKEYPKDKKESLIRQGNNVPVQGTAADVMKIAEVNMYKYIKEKGWDKLVDTPQGKFPLVRVMLSAHDEVITSGHKSIPAEEIFEMHRECMEMSIKGYKENGEPFDFAPLFISGCVVSNWKEGKDDAFSIPIDLRDKMISEYHATGVCALDMNDAKKSMLSIINHHREKEIIEFMEGIIKDTGTDLDAVTNRVRHPSITHELISRFHQTEEEKNKTGELSHIESIRYAISKYLEFRLNPESNVRALPEKKEKVEEVDAKEYFEEITGFTEELSYFDDKGEVHYIGEESIEEEDTLMFDDEASTIHELTTGEKVYYWELFDIICIDPGSMSIPNCDELLKIIYKYRDSKGFYTVKLLYGGKLIDTKIKVERLDMSEVLGFIKNNQEISALAI